MQSGAEQHRGQRDKTQKCVNFCVCFSLSTQHPRGSREHRRTRQESRGAWPPLCARLPANLSPRLSGTRKAKKSATRDSRYDNVPNSTLRYIIRPTGSYSVIGRRKEATFRIKNEPPTLVFPCDLVATSSINHQEVESPSNKTNKMQKVSFLSVEAEGRVGGGMLFFPSETKPRGKR